MKQAQPDFGKWVQGLRVPAATLTRDIRALLAAYHRAEDMLDAWGRAADELSHLRELIDALQVAKRKMRPQRVPHALRVRYQSFWPDIVRGFDSIVDPVLREAAQAMDAIAPHRERQGNQGPSANTDILIAGVVRRLRDAGAQDYISRAHKILGECGVRYPISDSAFRAAAKRGAALLDGPPLEGSLDGLRAMTAGRLTRK
jgi:hypothetical protein